MKLWLASFPRSGNTFFRVILHEVYGIPSSTYHKETSYPVDPQYEEYPVVKTHLLPEELIPADPRVPAVYLVRDGRDALVSIAHHRSDLVAPGSDYRQNLKEAIIASGGSFFGGWSRNAEEWFKRAALVIRFEDLIRDPISSVERLRPWIDLPEPRLGKLPTFEDLKTKPLPYGSGNKHRFSEMDMARRRLKFFRRGVAGSWRDEMPPDLHDLFWKLHGRMMKKLGYESGESLAAKTYRVLRYRLVKQ